MDRECCRGRHAARVEHCGQQEEGVLAQIGTWYWKCCSSFQMRYSVSSWPSRSLPAARVRAGGETMQEVLLTHKQLQGRKGGSLVPILVEHLEILLHVLPLEVILFEVVVVILPAGSARNR